jgi:hypothetical protein
VDKFAQFRDAGLHFPWHGSLNCQGTTRVLRQVLVVIHTSLHYNGLAKISEKDIPNLWQILNAMPQNKEFHEVGYIYIVAYRPVTRQRQQTNYYTTTKGKSRI